MASSEFLNSENETQTGRTRLLKKSSTGPYDTERDDVKRAEQELRKRKEHSVYRL